MIKKICQLIKEHRYVAMNFLQHGDQAQVIIVVRTKEGSDVAPMNILVAPEELECALGAALDKAIEKAMIEAEQAAKPKTKPAVPPPMPKVPENDGFGEPGGEAETIGEGNKENNDGGAPAAGGDGGNAAGDDKVEGWD